MIEGYFSSEMVPLAAAATAFALMLAVTPLVISVARYMDWMDYPRAERWHRRPTALMGGIAIFAATLAALMVTRLAVPWWIWGGATIMFLTGVVDDRIHLRASAKIIPQLVVAVLPLIAGVGFGATWSAWLAVPLTILWVIGITNAVNLIDGMDGLAAGITTIAAGIMAAIAWIAGDVETAAIAGVLAASAAGFLVFNVHPARIFMGDGGSLFLGFLLAAVALQLQSGAGAGEQLRFSIIPAVILAVPIFDTTFVSLLRLLHNRRITQAGTDHTMHRLVRLGLSERRAVLLLCSLSAALGLLAFALHETSATLLYAFLAFVSTGLVVFGSYLASLDVYEVGGDGAAVPLPSFTSRLRRFLRSIFGRDWKGAFGVVADGMLVAAGFLLAHFLRFESDMTAHQEGMILQALPILIAVKIPVFYAAGLYRGIWRYAGTPELVLLVKAGVVASVLGVVALGIAYGFDTYSRSVIVLDYFIVTGGLVGVRLGFRAMRQYVTSNKESGRRTLLYGAGRAGSVALRELRTNPRVNALVIGFLDDEPLKHGLSLQGVEVVGSLEDLPTLCTELYAEELVICGLTIGQARRARALVLCREAGIRCRTFDLTFSDVSDDAGVPLAEIEMTDLLHEEMIALFQQAPENLNEQGKAHLEDYLSQNPPAQLLSEFYHDYYEELKTADREPQSALLAFIDRVAGDKT